jgi:hypothetical protein
MPRTGFEDVHRPCLVCARELTPEEITLCDRCDLLEPRVDPGAGLDRLAALSRGEAPA